jgi:hypothetical protein
MKIILLLNLAFFSFSTFAFIDSGKCPEKFFITYFNINRGPLTKKIVADPILKAGWDSVQEAQKFEQEFQISQRTDSSLCIYVNNNYMAYLQSNEGVDELVIPYNKGLYFRTKILTFSNDYIELAVDEDSKNILTPIHHVGLDGAIAVGEVDVGEAEAVNIQVLE